MTELNREALAKIIFNWLKERSEDDPYTYNAGVIGPLIIGVDGYLDCLEMAEAILRAAK